MRERVKSVLGRVPTKEYGKFDVEMPEFFLSVLVACWVTLGLMLITTAFIAVQLGLMIVVLWISIWYAISWGRLSKKAYPHRYE